MKRAWSLLWAARFVARFEGWSATPYLDPVGIPTQGYGHTEGVDMSDPPISRRKGMRWLAQDLGEAAKAVNRSVHVKLAVRQRMALISLAFNIGAGAFASSTLVKELNRGRFRAAADQFLVWNKAGSPLRELEGLTRRRKAERWMFLHPRKRSQRPNK